MSRYMVIRVELREDLDGEQPVRRKEAVLDLRHLIRSPAGAIDAVDKTALMLGRSMLDEAILMGLGDE
jgi:hypothetical protein